MYANEITPIEEQDQINIIGMQIADVLQESYDGRMLLMKKATWVAVPCLGFLRGDLCNRIHKASLQESKLLACSLTRISGFPNAFQIAPTSVGISALGQKAFMLDLVLFPPDLGWLILFMPDSDFFIFAGPLYIANIILGTDLKSAYRDFEDSIPCSSFPNTIAFRQSVFQQLKITYTEALEGTLVRFPEKVGRQLLWPPSYKRLQL